MYELLVFVMLFPISHFAYFSSDTWPAPKPIFIIVTSPGFLPIFFYISHLHSLLTLRIESGVPAASQKETLHEDPDSQVNGWVKV